MDHKVDLVSALDYHVPVFSSVFEIDQLRATLIKGFGYLSIEIVAERFILKPTQNTFLIPFIDVLNTDEISV